MAGNQLSKVLERLRHVIGTEAAAETTDAHLLERFVSLHDEAAFAAIVERHGPMVMGVCRRALSSGHDAEDAFQATFLLLVRKAGSLRDPELLGNWLYGVACRIARRAQANSTRQRRLQAEEIPDMAAALPEAMTSELRVLLDQELEKLPRKYRAPMVLCYLQGETNETAARKLRWAIGTLKTRLARARDLLREKLALRGLTLSAATLAAALTPQAVSAALPNGLADATVKEALRCAGGQAASSHTVALLLEGAALELQVARLKITALVLASLVAIGAGVGGVIHHVASRDEEISDTPLDDGQLAAQVNERVLEWQPTRRERRFDEIGWATSLAEATARARALNRPVFVMVSPGRIATGRDAASATNLRASAFSHDAIIDTLNRAFVPVYLSALDQPAELEWLRAQTPRLKKIDSASEVYILNANGQPVQAIESCHSCAPDALGEILDWFAVAGMGDGPALAPTVQSQRPSTSGDAIVLHLVARYLKRDGSRLLPLDDPLGVSVNYFSRGLPAENWLVLDRSQWSALLPGAATEVGNTWTIPGDTATLIYRHCYPPTEDNDLTRNRIDAARLTASVVARQGRVLRARLEGNLTMKHRFAPEKDDKRMVNASFVGYLDVDLRAGRVLALQLHSVDARYGKADFGVTVRLAP